MAMGTIDPVVPLVCTKLEATRHPPDRWDLIGPIRPQALSALSALGAAGAVGVPGVVDAPHLEGAFTVEIPLWSAGIKRMIKSMATLTKEAACEACTFWKQTEADKGECHRHAPQAIVFNVDHNVRFESRFPVTAGRDWCGDFSQK